jgi:hypothetical protein
MPRFLLLVSFLALCVMSLLTGALHAGQTEPGPAKNYKQPEVRPYAGLGDVFKASHTTATPKADVTGKHKKSSVKSASKSKGKKLAGRKTSHSKKAIQKKHKSFKKSTHTMTKSSKKVAQLKTSGSKKNR